jgi:hypothetical protein
MWNQDLSLGIDISDRHVSAVLLSRYRDKISVVKTASRDLPASAFSGDNTKIAQTVGRAIRQLLSSAGIRQKKAWVSFGSQGLLLQMVDTPEQLPANLGQYLRRQIRNSTQLNSKNPCLDFAAMTKNGSQDSQQCFVAAIDTHPIETLIKAMGVASLDPQGIDVPILSLCRALHKKQLSQGCKSHTLMFYLHGQDVYLVVFRKANLDYIRHLERMTEKEQVGFEQWSIEQIRAVVQYYEMEFVAGGEEELSWQFILASESHSDEMEKLKTNVEKTCGGNPVYLSDKTAASWLPIEKNPQIETLPLGATGAALRKWPGADFKTEIDLLPEQTRKTHIVVEYFMTTSKIAAAVLLLLLFLAYGLNTRVNRVRNSTDEYNKAAPQEDIEELLMEKKNLFDQLAAMKIQKDQAAAMIGGYSVGSIAELLDQIRQHTPPAVCMTKLYSSNRGAVEIDGYCPAMEDIQRYARLLETADYVKTAQVRQSETHPRNPNLRSFTIVCTLREGI